MSTVLVISTNGFSRVNCNKTYESIFSAFDKQQIYSFFTRPQDSCLDYTYCQSYYSVSESDIIRSLLKKSSACGSIIHGIDNGSMQDMNDTHEKTSPANSSIYNFFRQMNSLKENLFLKDMLWNTNLWWTKELKNWLDSIKADVIFFHDPGIMSFHSLLYKIVNYLNIPYIYYVTDDYYKYYTETWLQRKYLEKLFPICKQTLKGAAKRYCIGDMMAKEYLELFGVSFDTVMNCVKMPAEVELTKTNNRIASYFGGLHLDRWKMISRFADLFSGDVLVYTSTPLEDEMKVGLTKPNIKLMGCVYGDGLVSAMRKSDILLHIESDDLKFMQRTKLAVSTKIPEYLSTGKLTIGFGNPNLASMRILSDNQIGLVIDSSMKSEDAAKYLQEELNSGRVDFIRRNAILYANKHFSESIVAKRIKQEIDLICLK